MYCTKYIYLINKKEYLKKEHTIKNAYYINRSVKP